MADLRVAPWKLSPASTFPNDDLADLSVKRRHVTHGDLPDPLEVEGEVVVDDLRAKADQVPPGNVGVAPAKLVGVELTRFR
jgi:hypothetical protein